MLATDRSPRAPATEPGRGGWVTALAALVTGSLGTWLGLHGYRAFLTMVTWNVGEDLPALQMGLIAFGVYLVGLLAWLVVRVAGGSRPAWRMGLLFAGLTLARQAFPGEVLSPVLAFAALAAWLWWLPSFWQSLVRRGAVHAAVPGVLVGLVAQVAGQTLLHGLDLPHLRSAGALAAVTALAVLFILSLRALEQVAPLPPAAADGGELGAAWGAVALGPYLFLQMTLLTNLGRVQELGARPLDDAALVVLTGLGAALVLLGLSSGRLVRLVLGLGALGLLVPGQWFEGDWIWLLVPVQVGVSLLLDAAFAPRLHPLAHPATAPAPGQLPADPAREWPRGSIYGGTVTGALLLFALLFLFYSRYGWPLLWPVAVGLLMTLALRPVPRPDRRFSGPMAVGLAVVVAAVPLTSRSLTPAPPAAQESAAAPAELRIFNYNIHNGFDAWSVPAMEAIAATIAQADADIVTLQEVNRGWNLSGGVDLVAWLRWRFPQYQVIYGPMNGRLWGNVIMTRYPAAEWGVRHYPLGVNDFPRGLVWARIPTQAGDLLLINTHLTAYAGFDADRTAQAEELVSFWSNRRRTVVAGDFNAHPTDAAIRQVMEGGLRDVPAALGLGEEATYSATDPHERIDYILASPDVVPVEAAVPRSEASDHLPVQAVVRLR